MNRSNYLNSAFTIIELLIVIVIIGTLVAITAVAYTSITKQANNAATNVELSNVKKAVDIYFMKNGSIPENAQQMDEAGLSDFMKKARFLESGENIWNFKGPTVNKGNYLVEVGNMASYNRDYINIYYWDYENDAWSIVYRSLYRDGTSDYEMGVDTDLKGPQGTPCKEATLNQCNSIFPH